MIKALSLAAALALLPAAVLAQDHEAPTAASVCRAEVDAPEAPETDEDGEVMTPSVQRLEEAARAFGEKMETFGTRAGTICENTALDDAQKEARISALWAEYQPDLNAFTAFAAQLGPQIAAEALSQIDVESLVEEAMTEVEASGAMQGAMGVARNSAWTSGDPEHMATMGLVAQYAAGEAMDAMEEAEAEADAAKADTAPQKTSAPRPGD